jgi:hypothetical protein
MPSQLLYVLLNYGSMALVVAAMVVGVVLTKGTVRTLLAAALGVEVVRIALGFSNPTFIFAGGEVAVFAYSVLQMLLSVAPVLLLVVSAIVGARKLAAKEATISALTDTTTDTWRQPETSPDPRLLAD